MSVTDFLGVFFPDVAEPIWLRTFDAKAIPAELKGYPHTIETCRAELKQNKDLQSHLKTINATQGLYFVVNAGGNTDSSINRVNAIFCEMDNKSLTEQHDIFDNESPWSPSIRVETKKSVHAYWLLAEPITCENFLELQQGLIKFYDSDKSIKNLSRVMRLPYFNHISYDNGYQRQPIKIHTFRPDWRYTLAELREGFPHTPTPKYVQQFKQSSGRLETLEDVKAELRARIMDMPSWSVSGKWGCANGICHNGVGDTGLRVDLASGAVTCWSECTLKQILDAFGLEIPKGRSSTRQFEYIDKRKQKSRLYQWLQERKKAD